MVGGVHEVTDQWILDLREVEGSQWQGEGSLQWEKDMGINQDMRYGYQPRYEIWVSTKTWDMGINQDMRYGYINQDMRYG